MTITPRSPSSFGVFFAICVAHRRSTLNVPMRLISITLAKISSGIGPALLVVFIAAPVPAQLTLTWMAPNCFIVCCTAAFDLGLAGDVGRGEAGVRAQLLRQRGAVGLRAVDDHHLAAAGQQLAHRRQPEPGRAAGHQCHCSCNLHRSSSRKFATKNTNDR